MEATKSLGFRGGTPRGDLIPARFLTETGRYRARIPVLSNNPDRFAGFSQAVPFAVLEPRFACPSAAVEAIRGGLTCPTQKSAKMGHLARGRLALQRNASAQEHRERPVLQQNGTVFSRATPPRTSFAHVRADSKKHSKSHRQSAREQPPSGPGRSLAFRGKCCRGPRLTAVCSRDRPKSFQL